MYDIELVLVFAKYTRQKNKIHVNKLSLCCQLFVCEIKLIAVSINFITMYISMYYIIITEISHIISAMRISMQMSETMSDSNLYTHLNMAENVEILWSLVIENIVTDFIK